MNKTTDVLQYEIKKQNTISKKLHISLDSLEMELTSFTKKDSSFTGATKVFDTTPHSSQPQRKKIEKKKDAESIVNPPAVSTIAPMKEIRMYAYESNENLGIREYETITHINCILSIQFDEQKIPIDSKAEISIQQRDEETNKIVRLSFRRIASQINPDGSFDFIFQEIPLPAANEFDAQNLRKLSVSLIGTAGDPLITARLAWNQITGRPVTALIKMAMKKK